MEYVVVVRYQAIAEDTVIVEASSKKEARENALNGVNVIDITHTDIVKSGIEKETTYCEEA